MDVNSVLADYITRDRVKVERFIRNNPQIVNLLIEAREPIHQAFGGGCYHLELGLFNDPEGTNEEDLYAFIRTRLGAADAYARLQEFNTISWLEALPRATCKLTFSLAFHDA